MNDELRNQLRECCNLAVGIEKRVKTGVVPSDEEIATLIVGWCDACRYFDSELDDSDSDLVSRLFVASRQAVIELAVTLDMDAERLLADRTGESVRWRQMRAKATRIRGRTKRIVDHEKLRFPLDPEIQEICSLLHALQDSPAVPSVVEVIKGYLQEHYDSIEAQDVQRLRQGAYQYEHLWRS